MYLDRVKLSVDILLIMKLAKFALALATLTPTVSAVVAATVLVDALVFRKCPILDDRKCPAPGQFHKGDKVKLTCHTTKGTSKVGGSS